MIKKMSLFLLFIFILNIFVFPEVIVAADDNKYIRVSLTEDESLTTEKIIYEAFDRIGYKIEARQFSYEGIISDIEANNSAVLVSQIEGLEEEYPNLIPVPIVNFYSEVHVYSRNNKILNIESWEDLRGLRVTAYSPKTYISRKLDEFGIESNFVLKLEDVWHGLINDQDDVVLVSYSEDNHIIVPQGLKEVAIIDKFPTYTYLNEKYEYLLVPFMRVIFEMQRDGTMDDIKNNVPNNNHKFVLHISSYNSESKWDRELIAGIKSGLELDDNITYYNFELNSNNVTLLESGRSGLVASLRAMFIKATPDVIIVSDNEAMEFLVENYCKLFYSVPVVFCGVNYFDESRIKDISEYVTGCTESISVSATVSEMLELYPETKNIYVINDHTTSGRRWQQDMYSQISRLNLGINIMYNQDLTMSEILKRIDYFDEDTLILLGYYFNDSDGVYYTEKEVQEMLFSVAKTPIFVLTDSNIGSGGFGGMLSVAENQGFIAGQMTRQILDGEEISEIPIIYASEALNKWKFDHNIVKKFGYKCKNMPAGHVDINKDSFISEEISARVTIVCIIFALLSFAHAVYSFVRKKMISKKFNANNSSRYFDERLNKDLTNEFIKVESSSKIVMKKLESFMEYAPVAFVMLIDGKVTELNKFANKEIGLNKGSNMRDFFRNPDIYDRIIKKLNSKSSTNDEIIYLNTVDGFSRYYVSFSTFDFRNTKAMLLFGLDIEEKELQRDYIKRAGEDLQKIVDALPSAMAIINIEDAKPLYTNKEFLDVFGFSAEDDSLKVDLFTMLEQISARWQGTTISFEYRGVLEKNEDVFLKIYADQIVFNEKNCFLLICQDISKETKRVEMLKRAAEKEKEANVLKGVFLANMSHEIRTPMNVIVGLAQLALMKEQTPENTEIFNKINQSTKNLLSIINDILDFSKIEAEKMDIVEEEFSLEEVINNAFLVTAERIEDKDVEILLEMDFNVPCNLIGDKTRLWQILKNLLDNSVKYTSKGQVILGIKVNSRTDKNIELEFTVADTGIGMTKVQLERLFKPFEQFHRNNSKKAGTGLGLSITNQLVKLMNGDIYVESEAGEGTKFFINIPFKLTDSNLKIKEAMKEIVDKQLGELGNILLVDDDEQSLNIMSRILNSVGFKTVCADNYEKAIEVVKKNKANNGKEFKIIILDYLLGEDTNGIDLAYELNEITQTTRLLLVTAYARRVISDDLLKDAGFKDVIEKPFIISSFLQKVCDVVPKSLEISKNQEFNYLKKRVLLCEDNEINQMVASGILNNFGIDPAIAENGQEAIELLEKQEFDLIFMDIIMPVLDGHETTVKIRQSDKPYKDIPIVAMTANVMLDEVNQCKEEGMNGHIEKPIDVSKIKEALDKFLC